MVRQERVDEGERPTGDSLCMYFLFKPCPILYLNNAPSYNLNHAPSYNFLCHLIIFVNE